MTDPSSRYKQSREKSPKELDARILAAANAQAAENRKSSSGFNWKSSNWIPLGWLQGSWLQGAAFACVCLVGVTFILDTDTRQLTDDIDLESSVAEVSLPGFDSEISVDTDEYNSGLELEEVVVTAMREEESTQDSDFNVQGFSKASSVAQKQLSNDEMKERRAIERKRNVAAKVEGSMDIVENAIEHDSSRYSLAAAPAMALEEVMVLNDSVVVSQATVLLNLEKLIPSLILDIRYFGSNNFVGSPIDGYFSAKALMAEEAAEALVKVQNDALAQGLSLKVFDAYRPQRAVNHFVRWAEDLNDLQTKPVYYPNVEKNELFAKGYIAAKSGHSRASTVDLTLVDLETGKELDMGSPFDFFDPISWPSSTAVSKKAQSNRQLLRSLMTGNGFKPYEAEWWHFTLKDEPFPNQYFDIPVE